MYGNNPFPGNPYDYWLYDYNTFKSCVVCDRYLRICFLKQKTVFIRETWCQFKFCWKCFYDVFWLTPLCRTFYRLFYKDQSRKTINYEGVKFLLDFAYDNNNNSSVSDGKMLPI